MVDTTSMWIPRNMLDDVECLRSHRYVKRLRPELVFPTSTSMWHILMKACFGSGFTVADPVNAYTWKGGGTSLPVGFHFDYWQVALKGNLTTTQVLWREIGSVVCLWNDYHQASHSTRAPINGTTTSFGHNRQKEIQLELVVAVDNQPLAQEYKAKISKWENVWYGKNAEK